MAKVLHAKRAEDLAQLLDYVHDRPYAISELRLDDALSQLKVPVSIRTRDERRVLGFRWPRKGEARAELKINHARRFTVEDRAQIGQGDICTIEFDGRRVKLAGSLPVDVEVDVDALDVELDLPANAYFA